jgi:hypothetical protein
LNFLPQLTGEQQENITFHSTREGEGLEPHTTDLYKKVGGFTGDTKKARMKTREGFQHKNTCLLGFKIPIVGGCN